VKLLLAVDANIVVSELLRERGRQLIAHPALDLLIAQRAWDEAQHELRRRVDLIEQRGLAPGLPRDLLGRAFAAVTDHVQQVPEEVYAPFREQALARIPRDPDDWPTVAVALAFEAGIWTGDNDFLGCGVPTWTTETLLAYTRRAER
jgi:predicted nucleic acid-binding protein